MSPQELEAEAQASERLARATTNAAKRRWLLAKAAELRHLAHRTVQVQRRRGDASPPASAD